MKKTLNANNIFLSSKTTEISEHKTYLELLNRVCYYDRENANGVMLPYDETAEEKAKTLVSMPVVGKYTVDSLGKPTFKGHEASIDKDGNVVFGTTNIGVHTDVYFQEDEVELPDGSTATLPCLYAKQRIWSRNKNAVAAIQRLYSEDNLHNSWEMSVEKYEFERGVKKLTDYVFEANCLLGLAKPAFGSSAKVLTVASQDSELLVAEALSQDLLENNSDGNEVHTMEEVITNEVNIADVQTDEMTEIVETEESAEVDPDVEVEVEQEDAEESTDKKEKAELTMRDLRRKLEDSICIFTERYLDVIFIFPESKKVWAHDWEEKETDIYEFTYAVEGDEVILSDMAQVTLIVSPRQINSAFDEKNSALVEANNRINELTAEIATLTPYKEQAEKAEKEAAEAKRLSDIAELRTYVEDSKVFSKDEMESEEIASLVESLKSIEIKAMIADRIVAKASKAKPETSSVKQVKPRLDITGTTDSDPAAILRNFVHR